MTRKPTAAPPPGDSAGAVTARRKKCARRAALVVDDEPANRDFLVRLLQQAQLDVRGATGAADALRALDDMPRPALIVLDYKLPDGDGVDLLGTLRARCPKARLIMATMLDDRALMARAFANGCDVFLVKPNGFMELLQRLKSGDTAGLTQLIIDQHGVRPYRG